MIRLVAVALAFAIGPAARAFELARTSRGMPLHWTVNPVPFVIAEGGASRLPSDEKGLEFPAIRRAFLTWEAVAGSFLRFEYRGRVADAAVPEAGDGLQGVRFFRTGVPPDLDDAIGVTLSTFEDSTGVLIDADILFNERDYRFSTGGDASTVDLESVALHEAGHLVGLDHTCGASAAEPVRSCYDPQLRQDPRYPQIVGAVLYPLRGVGDPPLRALTDDDAAGLSALYPASPPQPGPRLTSVTPRSGDGIVGLTLTGKDLLAGASVRLEVEGGGMSSARSVDASGDRIVASVDVGALSPGCYDVVVQNPNEKQGILFAAFGVGGARCRDINRLPARGCACEAEATGGGALAALAAALVAWRRRLG